MKDCWINFIIRVTSQIHQVSQVCIWKVTLSLKNLCLVVWSEFGTTTYNEIQAICCVWGG